MTWLLNHLHDNPVGTTTTLAYTLVMGIICLYGGHRLVLTILYYRKGRFAPTPAARFADDDLPAITVQLPMFNEGTVAERIIDAACKLDYPADRLQVQVLDDSTDHTVDLCEARVAFWRQRGIDVELIHRTDRTGFKAGALEDAMPHVKGDLIAIFDADFVPEPDFLKETVHYFSDDSVGLVQTRWEHLNREHSLLTRAQAIFLDGHFLVEHCARNQTGRWMHFNGTGGVWRKQAMVDAGGWSARTLSEDLDLAIRAQLAGWHLVMAPGIDCPAELPPEIIGYKTQQHRWAKGTVQCLKRLYPKVLLSKAPLKVKAECFFQFTWPLISPMITLTALLPLPMLIAGSPELPIPTWLMYVAIGPALFVCGTLSTALFYATGQKLAGRSFFKAILQLPFLIAVGYGISLTNTRGVIEAILGHESPFLRTPKYNDGAVDLSLEDTATLAHKKKRRFRLTHQQYMPVLEAFFALYSIATIVAAFATGNAGIGIIFFCVAGGYIAFARASFQRLRRQMPRTNQHAEAVPAVVGGEAKPATPAPVIPTQPVPRPLPTYHPLVRETVEA